MQLAREVDFQKNGIITYYEFANKMDYTDDFARKEDKIPAPKTPPKSASQQPPKTAAPVRAGSNNNTINIQNNNNDYNPGDTDALSIDLGGPAPAQMSRQQSRVASRAGSGRATPNFAPLDSKAAYQMLQTERAVHQHMAELSNVADLPHGTPRRA